MFFIDHGPWSTSELSDFHKKMDFVRSFVDRQTIGPDATQVGLMFFRETDVNKTHTYHRIDYIPLDGYKNKSGLLHHFDTFPNNQGPGNSPTFVGLIYAKDLFQHSRGDRPGVRNNFVLITDSHNFDIGHVEEYGKQLQDMGVNITVVAIGFSNNTDTQALQVLQKISRGSILHVPDSDVLKDTTLVFDGAMCQNPGSSPNCPASIQALACDILQRNNQGKLNLATVHLDHVHDNSNAYNNIWDMCHGYQASRSSYYCSGCPSAARGSSVCLSSHLMYYLTVLSDKGPISVQDLAGGCHPTCWSRHYVGQAVDLKTDVKRHQDYMDTCVVMGGKATDRGSFITCEFFIF